MNILGISAFYHDSAACLVRDGDIISAAQEERFTRKKHDASFPKKAVEFCLKQGGIQASDLDYVGFYDKPFVKFERILETYLSIAPKGLRQRGQAFNGAERMGDILELKAHLNSACKRFLRDVAIVLSISIAQNNGVANRFRIAMHGDDGLSSHALKRL